ncbi:MAG: PfkB family carbohydrate kinase [Candidatus Omnitrophota bacterium]
MSNKNTLRKKISGFQDIKVLIIGDLILDEFLWGDVSRISPEAPVPVVWVKSESFMPGGASNVASNIHVLGGKAYLAGVVGLDERGNALRNILQEKGINIEGIFVDEKRPTTLKTRVIAHHQQVVRIDKENNHCIESDLIDRISEYVKGIIKEIDVIIIEDYGKALSHQSY